MWLENVVMYLDSGSSSSWWYPWFRSSFENIVAPFRPWIMSSVVGVTWRSRLTALLACLMSTDRRMLSGLWGFGATTIGETHGVGLQLFR